MNSSCSHSVSTVRCRAQLAQRRLSLLLLLCLPAAGAFAAPADFDSTFGSNGVFKFCAGSHGCFTQTNDMTVMANGRILLAGISPHGVGGSDWLFARLTATGRFDTSFNGSGWLDLSVGPGTTKNSGAAKAVVRSDGSILGVGWANNLATGGAYLDVEMIALNDNGSFDSAFGSGGSGKKSITYGMASQATALGLQIDGKTVVGGIVDQSASGGSSQQLMVYRSRPAGSYDPHFGTAGVFSLPGTGAAQAGYPGAVTFIGNQPLVGYYDGSGHVKVMELKFSDGTLDTAFGDAHSGIAEVDFGGVQAAAAPPRLIVVPDQNSTKKIVGVFQGADGSSYVFRLLSSGGLDRSRFGSGYVKLNFPVADIAWVGTGQIMAVAASGTGSLQVARITTDGAIDHSFTDSTGHSGIVTVPFEGTDVKATQIAVQPNGNIVIAGSIDGKAMVARLKGDTVDLKPDAITCAPVTNAALSTNYFCLTKISGLGSGAFVPYTSSAGTWGFITNGQTLQAFTESAPTHGTSVTTTTYVGGQPGPSEAPWDTRTGRQIPVTFEVTTSP